MSQPEQQGYLIIDRNACLQIKLTTMISRQLFCVLLCFLLPVYLLAQDVGLQSPGKLAQMAPDAEELTQLVKDFLAGASHNDPAAHERFWAEDLIYTSSSGRRMGKAEILREVRGDSGKPDAEKATYSAEEIRVLQFGTTAVVAFRLVSKMIKGAEIQQANYLNTGTFVKRAGGWQAVSWQSTKIPETPDKTN